MRGAEWDDGFVAKIYLANKGVHWPSRIAPPDWITDEDCVVFVPVGDAYGF